VLLLAIPMVAEMFMESLFAVVDIFWVSRLGSSAVAVVGFTESMMALVYALAVGLATGATALVSRREGEGDREGASRAAAQVLAVAAVTATVVGALGACLSRPLLGAMGASPEVIALGVRHTAVMLGGSITVVLLFVVNAVFRGAGDAALAMRSLWLANGLNIVLGPLLIFGLGPLHGLGVTGAAIATTLGRGSGIVYQLVALLSGRSRVRVGHAHARLDREMLGRYLRISSGGTLQSLVESASWLGLVRILASFGSAALAGYTVAIRVLIFALLPAVGIANAAATLVGQNLGAGAPARAERSMWIASTVNLVFLGTTSVVFIVAAPWIVSRFSPGPDALPFGIECLRIVAFGSIFYAVGFVVVSAFNGAGDVRTPTLVNLACFWALKIPVAWLLAVPLGFGPRGVFIAVVIAYSVLSLTSVVLFRRGRWRFARA
jgi:putative MATE family efflux protein